MYIYIYYTKVFTEPVSLMLFFKKQHQRNRLCVNLSTNRDIGRYRSFWDT